MNFIQLTQESGNPYLINPTHIVGFRYDLTKPTIEIELVTGSIIHVQETIEDIKSKCYNDEEFIGE